MNTLLKKVINQSITDVLAGLKNLIIFAAMLLGLISFGLLLAAPMYIGSIVLGIPGVFLGGLLSIAFGIFAINSFAALNEERIKRNIANSQNNHHKKNKKNHLKLVKPNKKNEP